MGSDGFRVAVRNETKERMVGDRVQIADTLFSRLIGLLGRRGLGEGDGLLIHPSHGVHTIGMMFTIDVLFLDSKRRVIGMYPVMRPFRISRIYGDAECVLELPARTIERTGTEIGDVIGFDI